LAEAVDVVGIRGNARFFAVSSDGIGLAITGQDEKWAAIVLVLATR
jgi:hypothetical protein